MEPELRFGPSGAIGRAVRTPPLGGEIVGSSADELGAFLKAESEKWGALIKELGISAG